MISRLAYAKMSFAIFILIHLLAAFAGLQYWPLTNYPMFSRPVPPFESFKTFFIEAVFDDHVERWDKSVLALVEIRDIRLQGYAYGRKSVLSDIIVRRHAKRIYPPGHRPQKIRIIQALYEVSKSSLVPYEKAIHEILLDP